MTIRRKDKEPELFVPLSVVGMDTPIGRIWVESDGKLITRLSYDALHMRQARPPSILIEAQRQLESYFKGKLKQFDLPLQRKGTRFQQLVWAAIDDIQFGQTRSYSQIAAEIGGRAIARTVGQACANNPIPIIAPCHRVIAMNGLLTGYVGGLWRKRLLLEHEGVLTKELF